MHLVNHDFNVSIWNQSDKGKKLLSNFGASILSVKGHMNLRKDGKSNLDMSNFNFQSIAIAMENFSNSRKIGQRGFGSVYKVIMFLLISNWFHAFPFNNNEITNYSFQLHLYLN